MIGDAKALAGAEKHCGQRALVGHPRVRKVSRRRASMTTMAFPEDTRELALQDGRIVRVRPLRPTDRAIYERAVLDLSPRSRYLRFFAPIARPSERLLDQMTQTDGDRHVAYLALTADETTGVGVVRYVRTEEDPKAGEVAIAVADAWQGRGLGVQLLRQTVGRARSAGLESLTATTLGDNPGGARLLQATGFSLVGESGPFREHQMRLRR
jgi:acetyltransferase